MKTFFIRMLRAGIWIGCGAGVFSLKTRKWEVARAGEPPPASGLHYLCEPGELQQSSHAQPWIISPVDVSLAPESRELSVLDAKLLERKTERGVVRCVDIKLAHGDGTSLLHRDSEIPRSADGTHLTLELERMEQIEPLTLVKANGQTSFRTLRIQVPLSGGPPLNPKPVAGKLSIGLALAPISFSESHARENSYAAFNLRFESDGELNLTSDGSTRIQASADLSALILQQLGNDDLRSFRSSARIVNRVLGDSQGLSFSLGFGPHFQTMLVPTDRFGFRNFAGPQISTHIEYGLASGGHLSAVTQLGLNGGFLALPTLSTTEWATRFTYHTGTLAPGTQKAWPSEVSYQFSSLAVSIHGIQMMGESHALGGKWNLF